MAVLDYLKRSILKVVGGFMLLGNAKHSSIFVNLSCFQLFHFYTASQILYTTTICVYSPW